MALPIQQSLGDARIEVLTRLGFAEQGTAVLRGVNLVDSWIRQATRQLLHECDWTDLHKELTIPLIEGQDRYDIPDETDIGQIMNFWVLDTNDRPWPLIGGLRWQDDLGRPDDETFRTHTGQPERYKIINQEIQIVPSPNDTFLNLYMSYIARLPELKEDSELLPFDSELIIQSAVIMGRVHHGMPGVSDARGDFARYLRDVKRQQREPRQFFVGGRKSHFIKRPKETGGFRFNGSHVGPFAPFTTSWNPWR